MVILHPLIHHQGLMYRGKATIMHKGSIHHMLKNFFAILDQKYGITYQLKLKIKISFNIQK